MPADLPLVNDENFDKLVLKSDLPVVVDFFQPGFPDYCNKLDVLVAVAKDYDGEVAICRADTRTARKAVDRFAVDGVPCLVIARKGKILGKPALAVVTKAGLATMIKDRLKP